VVEQLSGVARVLAGDEIDFRQHAQGAPRHVFEVADGGGDKVERARVRHGGYSRTRAARRRERERRMRNADFGLRIGKIDSLIH
jgi:hypothetical protein